jgi:Sec-independent protein translocase protein TatA
MIVILGLVLLVAAVVVGVAGVLTNHGSAHALHHGFSVLGYHVTGSTGTLFLYGVVVGAVAVLGLSLLLAGARRTSRRGSAARRGLKQSRSETAAVTKDRDDLIVQREAARSEAAGVRSDSSPLGDGDPNPFDGPRAKRHSFRHRAARRQDTTTPVDS